MPIQDEDILIFDGACGTSIQRMNLPASAWAGYDGCNEQLNISAPAAIVELHQSFLDAGAIVVETNTFGANPIVLAEYGLADETERLNRAAVANARKAIAGRAGRYVAGSVGPGSKLPSLGHIGTDELAAAYARQIRVLIEEGVDLLIVETCQDLLQAKTVVVTCREVFESLGRSVPLSVSVTLEETGTMLVGADIAAVVATFEPLELFSLGLNCATGPDNMASHVQYLSRHWPRRVSVIPNAGMPEVIDGRTSYSLTPQAFADRLRRYVVENGVSIVGGCCGTTPEYIARLAQALAGAKPAARAVETVASISSGYQAVELRQEIPPLVIGERTNANGSKQFRECLKADDFQGALAIATAQQARGAHAVDLCAAYAGRDEKADLVRLTRLFAESLKAPTVIDSTRPDCIEAALKVYPGRCVINSINLEDGGSNLDRVCGLARKYGAAVVALTIDEEGMAMTAERKLAIARRIYERAVGRHGLRGEDLLFDPLTFTIGSGDENLRRAAVETLGALRLIRAELAGAGTVLGVSNISFGLPAKARPVLNSVFLHEAVEAGLDAAIVDAGKILPLARVTQADRDICLDLIHDRQREGAPTPLMAFIEHFQGRSAEQDEQAETPGFDLPERRLAEKVLAGDREDLEDLLTILLHRYRPAAIINEILLPAMRRVGELFGRGEMLLPFVLQSAETMRRSVDLLDPYMERLDPESGLKIVLATVEGDVHDIGKNLVGIILSNNGYRVEDLGIKVPGETIVRKAGECGADVIGLSGLLVKSAIVMSELMPRLKEAGLSVPVLLGGAALTRKFVAESCAPSYGGPVVYCPDAFAGLRAIREHEAGHLVATSWQAQEEAPKPGAVRAAAALRRDNAVPALPFLGRRYVTDISPAKILPYVNEQALFRGRWEYKRGKMPRDAYERLIAEKVRPIYQDMVRRSLHEELLRPKVVYGYFRCRSEGDALVVAHNGGEMSFGFPRQAAAPHLCIADYFKPASDGGDVVAFFVVTVGEAIVEEIRRLYEADAYHDYLMLHGFSAEATDALAEYWHEVMREELGIAGEAAASSPGHAAVVREYQGQRYAFGYPACPNLQDQRKVFELLAPETIGVTLTESMEMVPEQSTSALIAHHPQAKYFPI